MDGRGFSLVELLVVMALIAGIGALVAPRVVGVYESHRTRLELARLVDYLAGAADAAFLRGDDLALHVEGTRLTLRPGGPTLSLDGPWRLEVARGLNYGSNGAAEGGLLVASIGGRAYRLEQRAGTGEVTVDDGH